MEGVEFPQSRVEQGQDGHSSDQLAFVAYTNLTKPQLAAVYELYHNEFKILGYSKLTDEYFPYIKLAEIVDNTKQDVQKASKAVDNEIKTKMNLPTDDSLLPPGDDTYTGPTQRQEVRSADQGNHKRVNQQSDNGDDPTGDDGDNPPGDDGDDPPVDGVDDGPMPMD